MIWEIQVIKDNEYRDFEYQFFTTLTRLKSLQNTWQLVKAHSLKGVGIGDLEPELRLVYEEKSADIPLHNQNYYLYIWASSGIMSLLSFLFFIAYWTRYHYVQNKMLEMKGLVLSYTIFIVLILMLDVVLKYHLGAVSIPLFLMSISALSFRKAEN